MIVESKFSGFFTKMNPAKWGRAGLKLNRGVREAKCPKREQIKGGNWGYVFGLQKPPYLHF